MRNECTQRFCEQEQKVRRGKESQENQAYTSSGSPKNLSDQKICLIKLRIQKCKIITKSSGYFLLALRTCVMSPPTRVVRAAHHIAFAVREESRRRAYLRRDGPPGLLPSISQCHSKCLPLPRLSPGHFMHARPVRIARRAVRFAAASAQYTSSPCCAALSADVRSAAAERAGAR